jgi:hypothetical protein
MGGIHWVDRDDALRAFADPDHPDLSEGVPDLLINSWNIMGCDSSWVGAGYPAKP